MSIAAAPMRAYHKIMGWIRQLYERTLQLSEHPKATWWLALISFAESSFFPIPPDVMLLPMCLANRDRAYRIAGICTLASVLGGLFGYLLGFFFFDTVGVAILEFYGAMDKYNTFKNWYAQYGMAVVFIAGFTPIPYKVVTITAGVFHFSILPFLLLSFASRGLRFAIEAWVVKRFGEPAVRFIDKYFDKLTLLAAVLFIGGFLAIKWLVPSH